MRVAQSQFYDEWEYSKKHFKKGQWRRMRSL